ncbi:hypothetical protein BDN72DRAFT_799605 [Pluteus cervinus]|uniref:Uncharacterized protein n=1 Tax=Pluteus cervinus TaxID=181527 RepID=A0ACD3AN79_9AGAR|nr:hypothetical protein BDN72DRAFT_799605 [Pluteus cervinus]
MSSSSSSSSSSRSPSPLVSQKPLKKPSKKSKSLKDKGKAVNENGKEDPSWQYKPPSGYVTLDNAGVDAGVFDWDKVQEDGGSEIWIIRVPKNISLKHLENMKLSLPAESSASVKAGTVSTKDSTYDVWQCGEEDESKEDEHISAEELKALSCLLPRKSENGELYPAPRTFARRLVVAAQPPLPSIPQPNGTSGSQLQRHKNPPRENHPDHLLKHQFMPIGSLACPAGAEVIIDVDAMEVDTTLITKNDSKSKVKGSPQQKKIKSPKKEAAATQEDKAIKVQTSTKVEESPVKGKKRKGGEGVAETPKKSKKAKLAL